MKNLNEIPPRLLLGPGPSNVSPAVLSALARPTIGHLDPEFLATMDSLQEMLREVLQTGNPFTIAVSGTGSAAMEAAVDNLVEPGDRVVVGVNGVFGTRLVEMARRAGGEVVPLEVAWGRPIPIEMIETALAAAPTALVMLVHGETSTGVLQPLEGIGPLCHEHGALLLIDCVTSLGGVPVRLDDWGVDACYSGSQKCLSVPPGLAPLSFSESAGRKLAGRSVPVPSWYLDMTLVRDYWSADRRYHHTAPINMVFALHEGLRLVLEEGLEERWERHRRHALALQTGLQAMGWELFVAEEHRLPPLTTTVPPDGVDEGALRRRLLAEHGIEVGGGLGPLAGKVVRIGLMGESSRPESIRRLLEAVEIITSRPAGEAWRAAEAVLTD